MSPQSLDVGRDVFLEAVKDDIREIVLAKMAPMKVRNFEISIADSGLDMPLALRNSNLVEMV